MSDIEEIAALLPPLPKLKPRDYLLYLKFDFDIDSQLFAISSLLNRNREVDRALEKEIDKRHEHARQLRGTYNEMAIEEWIEPVAIYTYQSAAHSMSAVGMCAPFIETLFFQFFQSLSSIFYREKKPQPTHQRWTIKKSKQWDCHYEVKPDGTFEKCLANGILQLVKIVGLHERLPPQISDTLSALFEYRNNMFHNGFEWPAPKRKKFNELIKKWPEKWFKKFYTNHEPSLFYLSDSFVRHCLGTINKVLDAMGEFIRDELIDVAPE